MRYSQYWTETPKKYIIIHWNSLKIVQNMYTVDYKNDAEYNLLRIYKFPNK